MSDVIPFPSKVERDGNGARQALTEIGKDCPFHIHEDIALNWADDLLLRLAARGFKVVPIEDGDAA